MVMLQVASSKEGEWSCYRGGTFNGGSGHITEVTRLRENGHVTELITLMKAEWSYYRGGQFKEGRMVMLRRSLMGGRMVMLQRWSL